MKVKNNEIKNNEVEAGNNEAGIEIRPMRARPVRKVLLNEQEFDLYTKRGISEYVENDEISLEEEGFMIGYLSS